MGQKAKTFTIDKEITTKGNGALAGVTNQTSRQVRYQSNLGGHP